MNKFEWLAKLIAFDTTSRSSNLNLIEMVQAILEPAGLTCHLSFDPQEKKANLFATLPAANGETNGGLVLSGHTDVVPVDGQKWQTNPFEAVLKDEKFAGAAHVT